MYEFNELGKQKKKRNDTRTCYRLTLAITYCNRDNCRIVNCVKYRVKDKTRVPQLDTYFDIVVSVLANFLTFTKISSSWTAKTITARMNEKEEKGDRELQRINIPVAFLTASKFIATTQAITSIRGSRGLF